MPEVDRPQQGPLVALCDASYSSAAGVTLTDVQLRVESGDLVCLAGPNGGGKSLTLAVLGGQVSHGDGRVNRLAKTTCLAPVCLDAFQTVHDAIRSVAQTPSGIDAVLGRCRLSPDMTIESLSSGQRQLLRLAIALASGRDLLLFDGPSANLDADGIDLLEEILSELAAAGAGVVVSTTDPDLMVSVAWTSVYTVGDGRVSLLPRSM